MNYLKHFSCPITVLCSLKYAYLCAAKLMNFFMPNTRDVIQTKATGFGIT